MRILAFIGFLSFCSFSKPFVTNNSYPKDFFASPVAHAIEVTGTFGELRPNHFHGGLDIRPDRSGVSEPIFAAADGYVSRIQVSAYGYGKIIYLAHANGFTTCYAHLEEFTPDLNEYIKANQYANESFEVVVRPKAGEFFFKKGQQIGMMGNTGGSQGTHLHFEIRETATDIGVNPLLFGFNVPDDKSPKFYELKIYTLDDAHQMLNSKEINLRAKGTRKKVKVKRGKKMVTKTIYTPPPADSPYTIEGDTLDVAADNVAFGIKTYDTANWSENTNGVYDLSLFQDENLVYNFNVEKLDYNEARFINAHIDYRTKSNGGGYFNRCYRLPGNQMSMFGSLQNDGVLHLSPQQISEVTIIAKDANLNPDTLTFYVRSLGSNTSNNTVSAANFMNYNSDNYFQNGDFQANFPLGCFYESFNMTFGQANNPAKLGFSPLYRLHQSNTPVHKSMEVKIRPSQPVADSIRAKLFVAFRESDGDIVFCGNTWQGDFLSGKNDVFGTYCIMADTTAPEIKPIHFSENMQNDSRMSFRISDNVKAGRNGLRYRATVDGQWILLSSDAKSPIISHYFDQHIAAGEHELVIEAEDKSGNKTFFIKKFNR
jgi:Peptidase family M23